MFKSYCSLTKSSESCWPSDDAEDMPKEGEPDQDDPGDKHSQRNPFSPEK